MGNLIRYGIIIRYGICCFSLLFLVSCAGGSVDEPGVGAPPAPSQTDQEAQNQEQGSGPPALLALPLHDVRSGEVFQLQDYAGKTVFIEPMATW